MVNFLSKMNTKDYYLFVTSTFLFLLFDFIFLLWNRDNFERQVMEVQHISLQLKPIGVVLCYFFLITGLYYFILRENKTPLEAFLFGIIIYGVYETTTYSLLKNWKFSTLLVDTLWGGVLFYLTTFFTYFIVKKWL